MSHQLHELPPITTATVEVQQLNVLLRAINDNFKSIGHALDLFEAPGSVSNLQTNVKGVPVRLIPVVPADYDPVYFASVIATLVDKINQLLNHLRTHNLIDNG